MGTLYFCSEALTLVDHWYKPVQVPPGGFLFVTHCDSCGHYDRCNEGRVLIDGRGRRCLARGADAMMGGAEGAENCVRWSLVA